MSYCSILFFLIQMFFSFSIFATDLKSCELSPISDSACIKCLNSLRKESLDYGISYDDFDKFTKNVEMLKSTFVLAREKRDLQEEWGSYVSKMINRKRLDDGIEILQKFNHQLIDIGNNYQVDPELLVAILGIETNYGKTLGTTNVLNAWFTRACTEKNILWKKNFYASIKLLRDGIVDPDKFLGSWSGAFGMTQFIPTSFYELAVDGDGDGLIDLYNSFVDAVASAANHFKKCIFSWEYKVPAVIVVQLPPDLIKDFSFINNSTSSPNNIRSLREWSNIGVSRINNKELSFGIDNNEINAYFFAPDGSKGPFFLVTDNFYSILKYNRSHRYALTVALLSELIKGNNTIEEISWFAS